MKTEVNVTADPDDIGKTVIGFGKSVKEGAVIGLYFGHIALHQKPRSNRREDQMP